MNLEFHDVDGLDVPIILVVFNRPEVTARLLERLALVRPRSLLVIADGPRGDRDFEKVEKTRRLFDSLPWACSIKRCFSDVNLGCAVRVSSGLTWAFQEVEEAIILEDDCLPDIGFFRYAETLLAYYRDDTRVGSVGGTDFTLGFTAPTHSYFFSRYNLFWGWATWRRAWNEYQHSIPELHGGSESLWSLLTRTFPNIRARLYWYILLRRVDAGRINSWGYRWLLSCWRSRLVAVHPSVNMVENAGFGANATRTTKDVYGLQPARSAPDPIIHPESFLIDRERDKVIEDRVFSRSFAQRLSWALRKFVRA